MPSKTIEQRAAIIDKMPPRQKAHAHKAYEEFVRLSNATRHILDRYPNADNIRPCLDGFIFRVPGKFDGIAEWSYSREGSTAKDFYPSEEHATVAVMAARVGRLNLNPVQAIINILCR